MKFRLTFFNFLILLSVMASANGLSSCKKPKPVKLERIVLQQLEIQESDITQSDYYIWKLKDGRIVYGSQPYCRKITGYQGQTPVYIVVNQGIVESIIPGHNSESVDRCRILTERHFFDTWKGKTLSQIAELQVDAVSGATDTSTSFIQTIRRTASKVK